MPNTPDYRGVFLRGYGSQYSYHYGTVLHSSGNLGDLQGDSIRDITGSIGSYGSGSFNRLDALSGAFSQSYAGPQYGSSGTGSNKEIINVFNAALVCPTASENRPLNKAVLYLIKAK